MRVKKSLVSIVLVLLFRLYDITHVFEAHFSPLRVGVRGKNSRGRQSRRSSATKISEIFGSYWNEPKARINYAKNKHQRKLLATLNELYKIRVKLGKYRDENGKMKYDLGIEDELHIAQLNRVKELHKTAIRVISILDREEMPQQVMPFIDMNKVDEINDMIVGFNQYSKQNELVKLTYKEMKEIIVPNDIVMVRKQKDRSYQVISSSASPLDNTGVEDLEIKLRDSASITSTPKIYNKRIEKHNEDIKNKDVWCCKKCGFGHIMFEVI